MDFSKKVKASEAADYKYAEWYSGLPDEKKAQFFQSGFQLVAEKIKYDVRKENPFSTEADVVSAFIERTQKEDYPESVMSFIHEKMAERSEAEWKQRFRAMKKELGWSYEEMATYMNAGSGASVKASVNRKLPAFAKLAVCVFESLSVK